jgi:hypothetical protein
MKIFKEESGAYGNGGEGSFGLDGPSFPAGKKKGVVGEDAPVNSVSGGKEGGQIASVGIQNPTKGSSFSEPGVSKTKYKDTQSPLLWPEMMRRTIPNMVKEERKKVKIKLNPEKEIGYTVHSVGPGRKLTLTKSGTSKVKNIKEETFAGAAVFEVDSATFHAAKFHKRKGKHWRKYLGEDDCLSEIRDYATRNPGKPIIIKNKTTGEMCHARYGKGMRYVTEM